MAKRDFAFGKENFILIAVAVACIVLGFIFWYMQFLLFLQFMDYFSTIPNLNKLLVESQV